MYMLQLTQRGYQKPTYQVELFTTPQHTRMLVSPRFVSLEAATETYNHLVSNLPKLKEHLLSHAGKMFALHPSTIHAEVYFIP